MMYVVNFLPYPLLAVTIGVVDNKFVLTAVILALMLLAEYTGRHIERNK